MSLRPCTELICYREWIIKRSVEQRSEWLSRPALLLPFHTDLPEASPHEELMTEGLLGNGKGKSEIENHVAADNPIPAVKLYIEFVMD